MELLRPRRGASHQESEDETHGGCEANPSKSQSDFGVNSSPAVYRCTLMWRCSSLHESNYTCLALFRITYQSLKQSGYGSLI